jgi:UDPglucose 6-dehydrogenase
MFLQLLEIVEAHKRSLSSYKRATVPVGTSQKVKQALQEELNKRNVKIEFDVASNPEFLKEGAAIDDF